MKRTVTIRGLKQLRVKLGAMPAQVDAAGRRVVSKEVDDVANDMRRNAPVKTGALKEGIQAEYDDKTITGTAVTTAPYSEYVIHGTEDTPAQDFMTPAALRSQGRFRRRLIKEINREIGGMRR